MGNEISGKMLDDLPSILDDITLKPSKGFDIGLEDAGAGIGGAAGGAAAGIGVGILDGTAQEAIDAIRGKNDRGSINLGPVPTLGPLPSGPIGRAGPDLSDIFRDAAEESQRQRDDEIEKERKKYDDREDEEEDDEDPRGDQDPDDWPEILDPDDEEDDEDEDDQPKEPPRFPPSGGIVPVTKPTKPEPKPEPTPEFIVEPITMSLLRAEKMIPKNQIQKDDIESDDQSIQDKIAYEEYKQGMKPDVNNTHLETVTDHMIRYSGPLKVFDRTLESTLTYNKNNDSLDVWKEYTKQNMIQFSDIYTEALFTNNDPQYQPTNLWVDNRAQPFKRSILV